jgi:hypothetical protein
MSAFSCVVLPCDRPIPILGVLPVHNSCHFAEAVLNFINLLPQSTLNISNVENKIQWL